MNYGTYLATSGVLASMRRMDVIANNLANANTNGFKPDIITPQERPAERLEGRSSFADPLAPSQDMLEKLGGGLRFGKDRIDLSQGPLERTLLDTDIAIRGEGFFVLASADGKPPTANSPIQMTRDGALVVDGDGILRVAGNGRALIGEDGRPVKVDPEQKFAVDRTGRIYQDGDEVARIRIVRPLNPAAIEKLGQNILSTKAGVERVPDGAADVAQGMLEGSGSDPVNAMVEMIRQSRLMEANLRMMQYQDNLTGQAIAGITRLI
ncbi:MAG: flagellar hook basal-body protein [Phycisphaerae bacterium]|nr:flagellar hook basal-body protein [Phycisphaerae bacterium]